MTAGSTSPLIRCCGVSDKLPNDALVECPRAELFDRSMFFTAGVISQRTDFVVACQLEHWRMNQSEHTLA